jgi:hypothetical protein
VASATATALHPKLMFLTFFRSHTVTTRAHATEEISDWMAKRTYRLWCNYSAVHGSRSVRLCP